MFLSLLWFRNGERLREAGARGSEGLQEERYEESAQEPVSLGRQLSVLHQLTSSPARGSLLGTQLAQTVQEAPPIPPGAEQSCSAPHAFSQLCFCLC